MAISYYVGVPRSGKTYKAMSLLYYTFVADKYTKLDKFLIKNKFKKPKQNLYKNAYTNINQFNFEVTRKIMPLDYDTLYVKLTVLHGMYMKKQSDSELIEYAKSVGIYKSLFVIDECHNYLKNKEDKVLVWWFTYHAHLHHDLILITQDLSLVNAEYKRVAEYFYKAVPSRFRVSKNTFKYNQFSSHSMYKTEHIGTEKVKANQKIFDMYVSGADEKSKSLIHKYILLFVLIAFFLVWSLFNFFTGLEENLTPENEKINSVVEKDITSSNINEKNIVINEVEKIEIKSVYENKILFKFNCFTRFCYVDIKDKNYSIPVKFLSMLLKDIDPNNVYLLDDKNMKYKTFYIIDFTNKFNFLINEKEEDKKSDKKTNSIMSFN